MKRLFLLLLICCSIAGTVGCAKNAPDAKDTTASTPDPVTTASEEDAVVTETDIMLSSGEWALPGTLTLPAGDGPFPLVIFVHGSGPMDRDETIGKTKLFKDLAASLAQEGIATIRYDKRTYLYASKMALDTSLTVQEEVIEDALHAVAYGKTTDKIDSDNIFIAGHSMGGYLIPRIDQADTEGDIAGYISLAGSARPLMDLMLEQTEYLLSLTPELSEEEKSAQRKQVTDACEEIANLTEADAGSGRLIMGACPTYWLDLAGYQPTEEIKEVKEPLLFLQGEHDYQVTVTDFNLWKVALEGRKDALFQLYPELTHTFTATENMGTPADYQVYAAVDPIVADDMSAFIQEHLQ